MLIMFLKINNFFQSYVVNDALKSKLNIFDWREIQTTLMASSNAAFVDASSIVIACVDRALCDLVKNCVILFSTQLNHKLDFIVGGEAWSCDDRTTLGTITSRILSNDVFKTRNIT